jgi:hypothetical protein
MYIHSLSSKEEMLNHLAESYGFSWEVSNPGQGIYTFWNKETKRRYVYDSIAAAVWMWIREQYGEELDMFEYYRLLPDDVNELIDEFAKDGETYDDCDVLGEKLAELGWYMDYGLDASPYALRPIIH